MIPMILQLLTEHRVSILAAVAVAAGAVLTALFHPRTTEDFVRRGVRFGALQKIFAGVLIDSPKAARSLALVIFAPTERERASALVSLVAAVTLDPPKILEGIVQLVTGRDLRAGADDDKGDPPMPPAVAVVAFVLVLAIASCKPAETPREQARGTILTIAFAVRAADETCAAIAKSRRDVDLATTCAKAFDAARDSLIGAEASVDAWDRGASGDVSCAVARGVSALTSIVSAVRTAGGTVPPVVDDALRLAPLVTGVCRG